MLIAIVLGLGASASTAMAATTDAVLHDQATAGTSGAKYADGSATYDRNANKIYVHLHTSTPYLFVASRAQIVVILDGQSPWGGESQMWAGSYGLTACATTDPTCSSNPSQDWTVNLSVPPNPWTPAPPYAQYASSIHVAVAVH